MLNLFNRNKNDLEEMETYEEDLEYIESLDNKLESQELVDTNEIPLIIESYPVDYDDELSEEPEEDDFETYEEKKERKHNIIKKITNIIFAIIVTIILLVSLDIVLVSKYNVGPFFAIKTHTYKDGGSKEYYGLGYKVIKYNQKQGRRDIEIGNWNLKYNTTPIDTTDLDLAIEFENNNTKTADKYYKKFVRISSNLKSIDKKNNKIVLEYTDEDKKYTLDIYCDMADKKSYIELLEKGDKVNVIGTISKFKIKTKKNNNSVYLTGCFAEQAPEEIVMIEE